MNAAQGMRLGAKSVLAVIGAAVVAIGLAMAVAVVREPGPLAGDALAQSSEAVAYGVAQTKALAALGVHATDRFLELKNPPMRAHAYEAGTGAAPVVFIHGGGSTALVWAPLVAELGARHLVAVDRPGCGLTDGVDYSSTDLHQSAVAFVGATLDALGLERAVLVGNSMGGLFSIWFALEHPERVAGIVLAGTPAVTLGTSAPKPMRMMSLPGIGQLMMMKSPGIETMKGRMASSLGQHAVERAPPELLEAALRASVIPGAGKSFRTLVATVLDFSGAKPGAGPEAAQVGRLGSPTLWILGDADNFSDPGFPSRVHAALPSAEMVVLHGAGHTPWLDDPKAVAQAMGPFLDRLVPAAMPLASGR